MAVEFPYKKYFMHPPSYYFKNLLRYRPKISYDKSLYYRDSETGNKYYYDIIIDYCDDAYTKIDQLTDYFNEKERVKAKVKYSNYSPFDYYTLYKHDIEEKFKYEKNKLVKLNKMREFVYENTKEATLFKISSLYAVLRYIEKDLDIKISNSKVLDPSSGWGDRLITFLALNVKEYVGYDPNVNLQKGYNKIIKTFNKQSKITMIPSGFEYCNYNNYFDIVLTSPPYYDVEEYTNDKTQSIKKYKSFYEWRTVFFRKYLINCVNSVIDGGLIFIHISNNKDFKIVDFLQNEMTNLNCLKYKTFGLQGANKILPIWSWIKMSS